MSIAPDLWGPGSALEGQPFFRYARRVVDGTLPAPDPVRLACQRFFDDLAASSTGKLPFHFDLERALRPIRAMQLFANIKGPQANHPIVLMDWQTFIVANLFGWVDEAGARRFRQAYVFCPRGNGKTTFAAPMALYCAFIEGESGAEVYSAAVTRDQAKICFSAARNMAKRSQRFCEQFGVTVGAHAIFCDLTASTFTSLSSDAKSLDGLNVHFALLDEVSHHRTPDVYDALVTALAKRRQPMLMAISTASHNSTGIGKGLWDYGMALLDHRLADERVFTMIWTTDEDDDPYDEEVWKKVNPGWGVTVQPDAIRSIAHQARQTPAREAAFFTRHLNIWVASDEALFSRRHWHACADPSLSMDDYEGRPCFCGLDLASKTDLTAIAFLFPPVGTETRYALFCWPYLPSEAIKEARNVSYEQWARSFDLNVTQGEVVDYQRIEIDMVEAAGRFQIEAVGYDPWGSSMLAQRLLEEHNIPMVEVKQNVGNFSEPTKEFDKLIREGKIRHDGNPVLEWAVLNVVGHYDAKGNVYPRRPRPDAKIDPAMASIEAIALSMHQQISAYSEERGMFFVRAGK